VNPGFSLSLADGSRWLLQAGDPAAAKALAAFAAAARLSPAAPGDSGRLLQALTVAQPDSVIPPWPDDPCAPLVCLLNAPADQDELVIAMMRLSLALARAAQSRGGLLLHGALAALPAPVGPSLPVSPAAPEGCERARPRQSGVILAGPGSAGKTTTSNRLPPPWRSLCDDTTLVVRDTRGQYWAHPFPTWSRFYTAGDGIGGSWDIQEAVPLCAIFFLSRSAENSAETPANWTYALALLTESVEQASRLMTCGLPRRELPALHREWLANARALAGAVPSHLLHISLTGEFWKEMEGALPDENHGAAPTWECGVLGDAVSPSHPSSFVVYTGHSMHPTLCEPDVLEIAPYEGRRPCAGDVVYFGAPGGGREIVHRVVAVTPQGVRTRGDNCSADDVFLLQPVDIIGQVVAARRGAARRTIAGGRRGQIACHAAHVRCAMDQVGVRGLRGAYRALGRTSILRRLLPPRLRPRVVEFRARYQLHLKLMMGSRLVGRYDFRAERWIIQRPLRLLVDERDLPHLPAHAGLLLRD
jgi:hypothetical protein